MSAAMLSGFYSVFIFGIIVAILGSIKLKLAPRIGADDAQFGKIVAALQWTMVVMAILAGTDITSFQHFINDVRIHRNQVVEYIRLKTDNFSSASFFATCTEEEAAEYTRLFLQERQAEDETERARAGEARSKLRAKKIAETPPSLGLQDFPWFRYRPSLAKDIQTAIPDLMVLVITNVVLFVMCFAAFVRYDVR